jgi:HD-like signal output (HDOD) protein
LKRRELPESMKRILFVDDDPAMSRELAGIWGAMPSTWEMEICPSGSAAFALMEQKTFDVVVANMHLAAKSGAELLDEVMARHPRTVRLILADRVDKQAVARCVASTHQYLSKPCNAAELRAAIERVSDLEASLPNEILRRLVGRMDRLPSLPTVYLEIQEALHDPDRDLSEFGRIVGTDIAMTAQVLKLVNSAFFGLRREISDATEAVGYLGVDTLQTLVLTVHLFTEFEGAKNCGFSLEALSRHSFQTALACKAIARHEQRERQFIEQAFCAGMLHDTGKLILAHNFPVPYGRILEVAEKDAQAVHQVEQRVLGASHADVGGLLLGLWGLPSPVVEAIALHHKPGRETLPGLTPLLVLCAADALANGRRVFQTVPGQSDPFMEAFTRKGLTARLPSWQVAVDRSITARGAEPAR